MATSGERLLGVDVGTSAVKAVLTDRGGALLASHVAPLSAAGVRLGEAEQDPEDWWRATVSAVTACLQGVEAGAIVGVGLTGQKHALVPLDEAGRAVRPAMLWSDGRAAAEAAALRDVLDPSWALPGFLAPKWAWFRTHERALRARTRHLVFAKDFIRLRLTGELATDPTEASATGLYDFDGDTWSRAAAAAIDLPPELLPPVTSSVDVSGLVSDAAAAELGVPSGTPVAGGAGDNEAAAVACGAVGEGRVAVTLGTSGTVVAWAPERAAQPGLVWTRHVRPTGFAATGTLLSAGRSLDWVLRTTYDGTPDVAAAIDEAERAGPPDAPLVFVPGLVGERSPEPDPDAAAAFIGLRDTHTRAHLVRAVLEGVALSLAEIVQRMEHAGVAVDTLHLSGGGAASPFWRRLVAAAADRPVVLGGAREGPALGAAALAAVMGGQEGALDMPVAGNALAPDPAETGRLRPLGAMLRAARAAIRSARD